MHRQQTPANVVDMRQPQIEVTVRSERDTAELARRLAPYIEASDVVLLDGELAAGKTFFVRNLVAALGSQDRVSSPTYTIANLYRGPKFDILHVDAYRLGNAQEFHELGLDTHFDTAACFVEWGARVEAGFDEFLRISFAFADGADEARTLVISGVGARWAPVLSALARDIPKK